MDRERARVHVTHRVDQADDPAGATHAQAGQWVAVPGEMEEGVAGEHLLAPGQQPAVQLPLLDGGEVQVPPDGSAPAGRAQPGQPELRPIPVGEPFERIELADVVPGDHHRDLEAGEPGGGQVADRAHRGGVGTGAPDRVVDLGGGPVQRDLNVHVIGGGEPPGHAGGDLHSVGGELDPDPVADRVVQDFHEVGPYRRLAAADVHIEHLHPRELVDDRPARGRRKLSRVPAARAGKAVHARQVARVRQLPGEADGRGQPPLEPVHQGQRARVRRGADGRGAFAHGMAPVLACGTGY